MPIPSQIILEFAVKVAGTSRSPAQADAELAAVTLYENTDTDPILGQFFGLTVAIDVHTPTATGATRTLTFNMTHVPGAPFAPPPFPCNPITSTPPVLPYPLLSKDPLPGFFHMIPGSAIVATSESQVPSLAANAVVEFPSQLGVYYTVFAVAPTFITLTANYTGLTVADTTAVETENAPTAFAAIYSTSPLDSNGVAITPALPAGSGARTVSLSYMDSTGAGPFTVTVDLMGTYPSPVTLHAGSIDITEITDLHIATVGGFGSSVGQITLCDLSGDGDADRDDVLPPIPSDATLEEFQALIDQAQMLITRGLVYLPPSYFALAQPQASAPPLVDPVTGLPAQFQVCPDQKGVSVGSDLTGALAPTNIIEFAVQPGVQYTIATVSPTIVTLTEPFGGFIDNPVLTDAILVNPSPAAPPTTAQLAAPLGEFVNPGTAVPPPFPPLTPTTMSPAVSVAPAAAPNFLSGLFARTIQLALAVPVVQVAITLV